MSSVRTRIECGSLLAGKVADWTGQLYSNRARYAQQYAGSAGATGAVSAFAYIHDEEDSQFQLVDTSKSNKTPMQRAHRIKQLQFQRKQAQKEKERKMAAGYFVPNQRTSRGFNKEHQRQFKQWQKRGGAFGGPRRYDHRSQSHKHRPPSVQIKPDWQVS